MNATPLENRYEFLVIFDCQYGNPNGDPAANNHPRMDYETNIGMVTSVCLKHKVRRYIQLTKEHESPYKIFIANNSVLNKTLKLAEQQTSKKIEDKRAFMCKHYYDIRAFGGMMNTGVNCGQVRGPVQIGTSLSVDEINILDLNITRSAVTKEEDAAHHKGAVLNTRGNQPLIPYGLYVAEGFINAFDANDTGFSKEDLDLFWEALDQMFEHDRSASKGRMTTRQIIIFKHDTKKGCAKASTLFESVTITKRPEVPVARTFFDYIINIKPMPEGVTLCVK